VKNYFKALCIVFLAATINPVAAKTGDAGHGNDYRTFHTGGEIDYGLIENSYSAELVTRTLRPFTSKPSRPGKF